MIPKIIHYCWFGGKKLPKSVKQCIRSWKRNNPDYIIIEWNETNFDINHYSYTQEAYQSKKWAFVSDVARLYALYHFGGIYLDTDVMAIKSFDRFLKYPSVFGMEGNDVVMSAVMMSNKENRIIKRILDKYETMSFYNSDGKENLIPNTVLITNVLCDYGLKKENTVQEFDDFYVVSQDFFSPKDYITGILHRTPNTVAIHLFGGDWLSQSSIINRKKRWRFYKRVEFIERAKGHWEKIISK